VKDTLEREVKLAVPPGFRLPRIQAIADGLTVTPLPARTLSATYYDTSDLRLARWGITVRYRAGDATGWTVKLPEGKSGPALVRRELNFGGSPQTLPDEVSDLLRAYLRHDELVTVARLRTSRSGFELFDAEGQRRAELVDDRVAVLDGRLVTDRFRELEVEAVGEQATAVVDALVARLNDAGARSDDGTPKLMRALGPRATGSPEIVPVTLHPDAAAGDAVRAAIGNSVARLLRHDPGVRVGDDPEDVHQMRVATRRLRSDLRTFRSLVDPIAGKDVRDELKWLAAALGRLRDADVLLDRLRTQADSLPRRDAAGVAGLLRRLVGEQDSARAELFAALRSERYVALVERLVAFAQTPPLVGPWAQPASDVLPGVVAPTWKHLQRTVERLGPEPEADELHQVRIRAKRCRYAAEAVAPALGKQASRFASAVADLQTVLGDHQDAVVAEGWLREAGLEADASQALVAGELVALQVLDAARRRAEWPAAWERASKKRLRRWLS
jgi:CHAD domain-containing protein